MHVFGINFQGEDANDELDETLHFQKFCLLKVLVSAECLSSRNVLGVGIVLLWFFVTYVFASTQLLHPFVAQ